MKRALIFLLVLLPPVVVSAQILHVPADYASIQAAINASSSGDTVLVDEGTYYENIYFKGKAITVASRHILDQDVAHIEKTVINGSKAANPDSSSVVYFIHGEDSTSVLSGFTITGGNGTNKYEFGFGVMRIGGGILSNAGAKIINNIITQNSCTLSQGYPGGGGIFATDESGSRPTVIRNNNISHNKTQSGDTYSQGGGLFIGRDKGYTVVEQNNIFNNVSVCRGQYKANGGGIMVGILNLDDATILIRNNKILNNEVHCTASHGGGIFLTYRNLASGFKPENTKISIYNNIISGNTSEELGGGIAIWDQQNAISSMDAPTPLIYNNTITGNSAPEGAGLFNYSMKVLLFNNIFWNNAAASSQFPEISLKDGMWYIVSNTGQVVSSHNNIRGGYPGTNNISQNPQVDPENFTLTEGSPSIGRGTYSVSVAGRSYSAPRYDYAGTERRLASADQKIDQGALESPYDMQIIDEVITVPGVSAGTFHVYPNPAGKMINVRFAVINPGPVRLSIYDLSGREVMVLLDEPLMPGQYEVPMDISALGRGTFFLRLASSRISTAKLVVQ